MLLPLLSGGWRGIRRLPWATLLPALLAGALLVSVDRCRAAERRLSHVRSALPDTVVRLNDSTLALLAQAEADRERLQGQLTAAETLNGTLLAAVKLRVARRDTLLVHDTLVTTLLADSTRTATFRDSTFAGVVEGTVTAPPCCAALGLTYQVTRPAFEPSIGLVRVGDQVVATVVWQGERAEITHAFATPGLLPPKRFSPFVDVLYAPGGMVLGGGATLRLTRGVHAVGAVYHPTTPDATPVVGIGLRKTW